MARQPTLKQMKYLCAVAQHQHFGRAAEASHVSQSTLSAGIQELEETLSASLIERNNRKVLLTALGEDVVARSQNILVDVEELISLCAAAGISMCRCWGAFFWKNALGGHSNNCSFRFTTAAG